MLGLKVLKKNAQAAKEQLSAAGALAHDVKAHSDETHVFFPASAKVKISVPHSFENRSFESDDKPVSFKQALEGILTEKQSLEAIAAYDLVSDIAIIDVPKPLEKQKKKIALALLETNKRIKTVLRKMGARKGEFRLKKLEWLAGEKKTRTMHWENQCRFDIDVAKDYYSPRLAFERQRIAKQVKNGEKILALFAGVGPFPLVIAKHKKVEIKAVELNPHACKLMEHNIQLNKLDGKIEVFCGDAKNYAKHAAKSDRILMTLPKGSEKFLYAVVKNAKRNSRIHYYNVGGEQEKFYTTALAEIEKACTKAKRKFKVLKKRKVLPYAPRVFQIQVEFTVY